MVIREFEELNKKALKLEDTFFETEILPIYWSDSNGRQHRVAGQQTIVDKNAGKAISVVSNSYHFVHNYEAYQLADAVIKRVFNGLTLKDFQCFNVYMPKSKGSCRIDLILPSAKTLFPNLMDTWLPFVRISNSYNKSLGLKYEIGFCRWICLNGVIFEQRGITIRITHSEKVDIDRIKRMIDDAKEVRGIQSLIDEFSIKINKLKSFELPESFESPETIELQEFIALAVYCKVFNIIIQDEETYVNIDKKENDGIEKMKKLDPARIEEANLIIDRAKHYFKEFGNNAYAIFNILTDYATFPVTHGRQSIFIHGMQRKVGNWADEFLEEIQKPDFSFDKYIGEDVKKSAFFLESLIEKNPLASHIY